MKSSSISNSKAGAANALTGTIQTVPGLPTKLKIFKVACSRYWWARVYLNGRYLVRSLKTEKLREAQNAAKQFFIAAIVDAEHSGKRNVLSASVARYIKKAEVMIVNTSAGAFF